MLNMVVLRRLGLVLAVILGALALPATTAVAVPTPTADGLAPVAPEVVASVADGEAQVIALTDAPGDQVVDDVMTELPEGSARDVHAGAAPQVALTVDAEGLDALRATPGVERVVEDKVNRITVQQWETAIGLPAVSTAGWDGSGRTVAVLDTGVQANHPYLAGKVIAEACFSHATGGASSLCPGGVTEAHTAGSASPCPATITGCEHGTHVAGILAGGPVSTPTSLRGVAPAVSIVAVKVFSLGTTDAVCGSSGSAPCLIAYDSDINAALNWLAASKQSDARFANLDAVNMSLGGGLYSGPCDSTNGLTTAVNTLRNTYGVATVVATGNNGQGSRLPGSPMMSSPACISTTVSVGATTGTGSIAAYSNLTAGTTVLAPGSSILSSIPTSTYGYLSGTSMATPMVTGSIALLRERTPGASVTALITALRSSGDPISTSVGVLPEIQLDSAVLGVPGAVTSLVVTPGDDSAGLTWQVPAYAGTSSITSYTATASPGGQACTATVVRACTITGLTNGTTYTFDVVASNSAGAGPAATAVATPRTTPGAPQSVTGVPGPGSVTVSWTAPADDGGDRVTGYRVTASPGGGSCTTSGGRTCTVTGLTNWTPYEFTVVATNGAGSGAASVASPPVVPRFPGGAPFGSLDAVTVGPRSVTVSGWLIDPDVVSPALVQVYVDGTSVFSSADQNRDDVAAAYPGYGAAHGYSVTSSTSGGPHSVCVYGLNVGPWSTVTLGCRTVVVPDGSPFGSLDAVTVGVGTVSVSGWLIDPDVVSPALVQVYVDGTSVFSSADQNRDDVAAAYPGYGPAHGYSVTSGTSGGPHSVCVYGLNSGAGSNVTLGCRTVTVPGGSPFGSLDVVRRDPDGLVTVAGWAIDPDTVDPIQVHVYYTSPTTPLTGVPMVAGQARADVGAAYPRYGPDHGYSVRLPVPPGASLCAYAINTGMGETRALSCVAVP